MTKWHGLGNVNCRYLFFQCSGGWKPKIKELGGLVCSAASLHLLAVSSQDFLSARARPWCVQISPSYKTSGCIKGPASRYSWKRKWQPTPVFLPGESHGQRSLAGHITVHGISRVGYNLATKPPHNLNSFKKKKIGLERSY